MPQAKIPLLDAVTLTGLVQLIPNGPTLVLTNRVPKRAQPTSVAEWDIRRGLHNAALFNRPGAEANVVDQMGRSHKSVALAYLREKKLFDPVTLRWVREAGSYAVQNAQQEVAREVAQLNERIDNRVELTLWSALTGTASLPNVDGVTDTVDYGFLTSHKVTHGDSRVASVGSTYSDWSAGATTIVDMVNDIRSARRVIEFDGRVPATEAFTTESTMDRVFDAALKPILRATAANDTNAVATPGGALIS